MDSPPHGISRCAGCRVVPPDFPTVSRLWEGADCYILLLQASGPATLPEARGCAGCWDRAVAGLLSRPCTSGRAAFEHVFVLTLHLTRLSTFRPLLLSALFVASTMCVCVCVCVCVCMSKGVKGISEPSTSHHLPRGGIGFPSFFHGLKLVNISFGQLWFMSPAHIHVIRLPVCVHPHVYAYMPVGVWAHHPAPY